jgi:hypothetical protein
MAEIDIPKVDRDLLSVTAGPGPQLMHIAGHLPSIPLTSRWMVKGKKCSNFQGAFAAPPNFG